MNSSNRHINPRILDPRLSRLYVIKRSSGRLENDWKLREAHIASQYKISIDDIEDHKFVIVYKKNPNGGEMTKAVKVDEFKLYNPEF